MKAAPGIICKRCNRCGYDYPGDSTVTLCPRDGFELQIISTDPWVGSTLANRYRIEENAGSGGWGTVYLAEQLSLGRKVAVKVLDRKMATGNWQPKRFEQEARALSLLQDPSIVSVIDFGLMPQPYIVMEWVPGDDLATYIADSGPLPPREVGVIFKKLAKALDHAHSAGIVHRDLKPANIKLSVSDRKEIRVKVLDFGLARISQESANRLTGTGEILGSPAYMSPEQCLGHAASAASDIYALGCVVFELLTGQPPFSGETFAQYCQAHATEPVKVIFAEPNPFERQMETLIKRCLAKKPEQRFSSAAELVSALDELMQADRPADVVVAKSSERKATWSVALVTIASLVVVGVSAIVWLNLPKPANEARTQDKIAASDSPAHTAVGSFDSRRTSAPGAVSSAPAAQGDGRRVTPSKTVASAVGSKGPAAANLPLDFVDRPSSLSPSTLPPPPTTTTSSSSSSSSSISPGRKAAPSADQTKTKIAAPETADKISPIEPAKNVAMLPQSSATPVLAPAESSRSLLSPAIVSGQPVVQIWRDELRQQDVKVAIFIPADLKPGQRRPVIVHMGAIAPMARQEWLLRYWAQAGFYVVAIDMAALAETDSRAQNVSQRNALISRERHRNLLFVTSEIGKNSALPNNVLSSCSGALGLAGVRATAHSVVSATGAMPETSFWDQENVIPGVRGLFLISPAGYAQPAYGLLSKLDRPIFDVSLGEDVGTARWDALDDGPPVFLYPKSVNKYMAFFPNQALKHIVSVPGPKPSKRQDALAQLSTEFWRSCFGQAEATAYLKGDGPKSLLAPYDGQYYVGSGARKAAEAQNASAGAR